MKTQNRWRKAYSKERAISYEQLLRTGLGPLYRTILDGLVETFFLLNRHRRPRILDLGAGTGNVAWRLRAELPDCSIVCLDGSADMLAVARKRFQPDSRVAFVERDFGDSNWGRGLGYFDAVVSVGAIHHLDGWGKRRLFKQIASHLNPKGVFLCADPLHGSGIFLDKMYEEAWVRLIQRNLLREQGQEIPLDQIRREHRRLQKSEGDQPSKLTEQLNWLKQSGYRPVECFWKLFGFALFGGVLHRPNKKRSP